MASIATTVPTISSTMLKPACARLNVAVRSIVISRQPWICALTTRLCEELPVCQQSVTVTRLFAPILICCLLAGAFGSARLTSASQSVTPPYVEAEPVGLQTVVPPA
jgi:hypothetical protein